MNSEPLIRWVDFNTRTVRLDFVPTVRDDLASEQVDLERVLWSPAGSLPVYLAPVDALLFSILDGSATLGILRQEVSDELGISVQIADQYLLNLLQVLDSGGILVDSPLPEWSAPISSIADPPDW